MKEEGEGGGGREGGRGRAVSIIFDVSDPEVCAFFVQIKALKVVQEEKNKEEFKRELMRSAVQLDHEVGLWWSFPQPPKLGPKPRLDHDVGLWVYV